MTDDLREQLQAALGDALRVVRELGGGMARLFVAQEAGSATEVVVKVLPPDLSGGVSLERFRREIQVAGRLTHPNIVPVLSAGQAGKLVWYTMPLVGSESLRSQLEREQQLPLERVLAITRSVGAALTYAHGQNIVHRDIKPDNILLDPAGRAVVTDFGIARAIERSADIASVTSTGLTLGTPAYMSPEQAAGNVQVDGRSDVYSLGCMVYEMIAGEPPFTGPTAQAIIARHINEAPRSLRVIRPAIAPALQAVVERALAKNPADRYATIEAFVAALERPPAITIGGAGRVRRHAVASAALAVLTVGLATTVYQLTAARRTPPPDPTRVAVLPFDAPGTDSELRSIARGISRDVIASLPTSDVSVVSSAGVERFSPTDAPGVVSSGLDGAGTIVYGTVEPVGGADSMRVSVRLVDPGARLLGDFHVDAPRATPLAARDEVVRQVAEHLRRYLGREVAVKQWRSATRSATAWRLRQLAQAAQDRASEMSRKQAFPAAAHALRVADSLLAAAAAADTNWSEPRLARGWTTYGRAILLPDSLTPLLDAALAIAGVEVARSSGSPMALELRGWLRYRKWQLILRRAGTALRDSAESDVFRATALDPGLARAWVVLSLSLQDRGDNAGATDAARRAIAADPYLRDVAPSFSRLVFSHLNAERYDSARALCAVAASRFSDDLTVRSCILTVLGWSGQGTRDIREAANALARDEAEPITGAALPGGVVPVSRFLYAAVLARSGLIDSAAAVIAATRAATQSVGRGDDFLVNEAFVWTVLARRDTALALLTKLVAASPQMRSRIAAHPWFAPLKNDPRFAALTAAP